MLLAVAGSIVLWSTKTCPGRDPWIAPASPKKTSSTSSGIEMQESTKSARSAASRGLSTSVPPEVTNASALLRVRL